MTTTDIVFDKKIDNVQDQLDVMHREDAAFRGYSNKMFAMMATKQDLRDMEARIRIDVVTKDDLNKLTVIVLKIAEKIGVSVS